ncbi:MAG: sigma 54-interacting transcriptional regulator, partial [Syntrophaceae bacterium]|nr:sigma 54-interacting transcriptional regulator [Syntrophaceae bacterium]
LGAAKPIWVDVRVVSASNRNLNKACQEGTFRLDLYYRLKSAHIHLPPLAERSGDVPLLAKHFLKKACAQYKRDVQGFTPEAMELLSSKNYPGNVRELAQIVENAVLVADTNFISPQHLGMSQSALSPFARQLCTSKENDEAHLAFVLINTNGDKNRAAQTMGITVRQLQRKIAAMKKNPRWEAILRDI